MHCAENDMERSAAIEDAIALWLFTRDIGDAMDRVEVREAWRRVGREIGVLDR
jgi:hypothetical protein